MEQRYKVSVKPEFMNSLNILKEKPSSIFYTDEKELRILGAFGIPVLILETIAQVDPTDKIEDLSSEQPVIEKEEVEEILDNSEESEDCTEEALLLLDESQEVETFESEVLEDSSSETILEEGAKTTEEKVDLVKFTKEELENMQYSDLLDVAASRGQNFKRKPSKKDLINMLL